MSITTHGKKTSVPFNLPLEEESDVYSSVEINRIERPKKITGGFAPVSLPQLSLTLPEGATLVPIMRTPFSIGCTTADLSIPGDFVDDWHAILQNNNGVISVEDVRSTNGVFLKIENELMLEDHDEIAIGDHRFVFRTSWDYIPSGHKKAKTYGAIPPDGARLIQIFEGGLQGAVWFIESNLLISSVRPKAGPTNYAYINDTSISSPHATIVLTGEGYVINDMDSASGIFVRLAGPVELVDGDTFLIVNTPISLRYP